MVALHVPKVPLAPGLICCLLNFWKGKAILTSHCSGRLPLDNLRLSNPNPRDLRAHFPDFSSTGHCRHCSSFVTRRNMPCPLCLFFFYDILKLKKKNPVNCISWLPAPPTHLCCIFNLSWSMTFYNILYIKGFHVSCAAKQKQGSNSLEHGVFLPSLTYFGIWNTSTALKITMCSTDLYKFAVMFSTSVSILPERA